MRSRGELQNGRVSLFFKSPHYDTLSLRENGSIEDGRNILMILGKLRRAKDAPDKSSFIKGLGKVAKDLFRK